MTLTSLNDTSQRLKATSLLLTTTTLSPQLSWNSCPGKDIHHDVTSQSPLKFHLENAPLDGFGAAPLTAT